MIRGLENFALRNWQLRSIEGTLRLGPNVFQTFLSAPFDFLPDFIGPHKKVEVARNILDKEGYLRACKMLRTEDYGRGR